MKIIVCTGDENSMMFNGRRVSRDMEAIRDIIKITLGHRLIMQEYSLPLFADAIDRDQKTECCDIKPNIFIDSNPLMIAHDKDCCFIERLSLKEYEENIDEMIIYRWNRKYPYDFSLDIDIDNGNWNLISESDFTGKSHERISRLIYRNISKKG